MPTDTAAIAGMMRRRLAVLLLLAACLLPGAVVTLGALQVLDAGDSGVASSPVLSQSMPIRAWHPWRVTDALGTSVCVSDHDGESFPPITREPP